MRSPGRARSQRATLRRHTASVAVCRQACGPTERPNRHPAMYPHRSAALLALPTVHQHEHRTGSYGRAECTERRRLMMLGGAWSRRAPSFALNDPHDQLHHRPVNMTGRADGSIRSSRSDATDTQDLANDASHDGGAGDSVRIEQKRENRWVPS